MKIPESWCFQNDGRIFKSGEEVGNMGKAWAKNAEGQAEVTLVVNMELGTATLKDGDGQVARLEGLPKEMRLAACIVECGRVRLLSEENVAEAASKPKAPAALVAPVAAAPATTPLASNMGAPPPPEFCGPEISRHVKI